MKKQLLNLLLFTIVFHSASIYSVENIAQEAQILNQKENDQKHKNDVIMCCIFKQAQLQAQQTGIQLFTAFTNLLILTGALFIWLELYTVNSQLLTMELQNNIKGSFYGH
jgi:hypothetical protein